MQQAQTQPSGDAQVLQNRLLARFWMQSCLVRHQFAPHHPQDAEHEQGLELRGVLGQPTVAHRHIDEVFLTTRNGWSA